MSWLVSGVLDSIMCVGLFQLSWIVSGVLVSIRCLG